MPNGSNLISIEQAQQHVAAAVRPLGVEHLPLAQAQHRTLAHAVVADLDMPPFDRAMMDGFAVRCADVSAPPVTLAITGQVAAGALPSAALAAGQAIQINTGASMPPGADAVVRVEDTDPAADGNSVTIHVPVTAGRHVTCTGTYVRTGEPVLPVGRVIDPAAIAILATVGASAVGVYRRPRVAVLVTGDELVDCSTRPTGAQIRNSNGPVLCGLLAEDHVEIRDLGMVGDDAGALAAALAVHCEVDVLCVTGGVSMGAFDLVPAALAAVGVSRVFHKMAAKPGKPTWFGVGQHGSLVFGLPGNPLSALTAYLLLIRPALAGLQGRWSLPTIATARLTGEVTANGDRPSFAPVCAGWAEDGEATAEPLRWKGSGDPFGLARANGLLVRRAHAPVARQGERVRIMPFAR